MVNTIGDTESSLFEAAKAKEINQMKDLLQKNNNDPQLLNARNESGDTLLMVAINNNDLDMVDYLIGIGADVNIRNTDGNTALMLAAENGHTEIVERLLLLLEKGADLKQKVDNNTPIQIAASKGHWEVVRAIAKVKSEPSEGDPECYGPALLVAAKASQWDIVNLLITDDVSKNWAFPSTGYSALHYLVEANKTDLIKKWFRCGGDVNFQRNTNKPTALTLAAQNKEVELDTMELLLRQFGIKVDIKAAGKTALYCACETGQLEKAKLLLENGADLEQKVNNKTLIERAAEKSDKNIIDFLCDKYDDEPRYSRYSRYSRAYCLNTALNFAAKVGNIDFVEWLLFKGADSDDTAAYNAAFGGHKETIEMLLDRCGESRSTSRINCEDQAMFGALKKGDLVFFEWLLNKSVRSYTLYNSLLHIAAKNGGNPEIVKLLIEKGADLEQKVDYETPIQIAASKGHWEVVRAIAKVKSEPSEGDPERYGSALLVAAKASQWDIVDLLLTKNTYKVHEDFNTKYTVLHYLVKANQTNLIKKFFRCGGDVNFQRNTNQPTALTLAAQNKSVTAETMKLLFQSPISVNKKHAGKTALCCACETGQLDKVKWLLHARAHVNIKDYYGNTALMLAAKKGYAEIVQMLLEKGADVIIKDEAGNTALMLAAEKGHAKIVQMLLEKGADVNITGEARNTALMLAAEKGHAEIVQMLLEKGAGVNIKNEAGNTALMLAAEKGHAEIVKMLLEKGADVNIKDKAGNTALMLAAKKGHAEIVELLLQYTLRYNFLTRFTLRISNTEIKKLYKDHRKKMSSSSKPRLFFYLKKRKSFLNELYKKGKIEFPADEANIKKVLDDVMIGVDGAFNFLSRKDPKDFEPQQEIWVEQLTSRVKQMLTDANSKAGFLKYLLSRMGKNHEHIKPIVQFIRNMDKAEYRIKSLYEKNWMPLPTNAQELAALIDGNSNSIYADDFKNNPEMIFSFLERNVEAFKENWSDEKLRLDDCLYEYSDKSGQFLSLLQKVNPDYEELNEECSFSRISNDEVEERTESGYSKLSGELADLYEESFSVPTTKTDLMNYLCRYRYLDGLQVRPLDAFLTNFFSTPSQEKDQLLKEVNDLELKEIFREEISQVSSKKEAYINLLRSLKPEWWTDSEEGKKFEEEIDEMAELLISEEDVNKFNEELIEGSKLEEEELEENAQKEMSIYPKINPDDYGCSLPGVTRRAGETATLNFLPDVEEECARKMKEKNVSGNPNGFFNKGLGKELLPEISLSLLDDSEYETESEVSDTEAEESDSELENNLGKREEEKKVGIVVSTY